MLDVLYQVFWFMHLKLSTNVLFRVESLCWCHVAVDLVHDQPHICVCPRSRIKLCCDTTRRASTRMQPEIPRHLVVTWGYQRFLSFFELSLSRAVVSGSAATTAAGHYQKVGGCVERGGEGRVGGGGGLERWRRGREGGLRVVVNFTCGSFLM